MYQDGNPAGTIAPVLKCPCCGEPVPNRIVLDAAQVIQARIVQAAQEMARQKQRVRRRPAGARSDRSAPKN